MSFSEYAPAWLMDLGGGSGDPLLDAMEEERRRRRAMEQPAPVVTRPTYVQPFQEAVPNPVVPSTTPDNSDFEREQREALEAQDRANALAARVADQEMAGVKADGQPHPSRQDTDGGLKDPGSTAEGVHAWDGLVAAASAAFNVPMNVIKAIIDIESKGDPTATSSMGAAGLMQVMGFHAKNGEDLYDPATNIEFGTRILAENFQRYGTWEQAAAAYFGAIDGNGNITSASDGNTDGYGYVDAFSTKAQAYADDQQSWAPEYGASLPARSATDWGSLRPSQLPEANPQLSIDVAYAACGPAAAIVFAALAGQAVPLEYAIEMGRQIKAWDEGVGMYGPEAEVRLIRALGGSAEYRPGLDVNAIIQDVASGNPVIVNSPKTGSSEGHYGVISGYDPASQRFYFGTSATDLKGGSDWMTLDEYQALNATGPIAGALFVDNPLSRGPSVAYNATGAGMPRSYDPKDTFKGPSRAEMEATRKEYEAAQSLAEQVMEQFRKFQEVGQKQVEAAPTFFKGPESGMPADQPMDDGASAPASLDLLRPIRDTADVVMGGIQSAAQTGLDAIGRPLSNLAERSGIAPELGEKLTSSDPWDWVGAASDVASTLTDPTNLPTRLAEASNRWLVNQVAQGLGFETTRPASIESERGELKPIIDPNIPTGESLVNTQKRAWIGVGTALTTAVADVARQNGFDPVANELEEAAKLGKAYLYDHPEIMRKATQDVFSSPYGLIEGLAESAPSILPSALGALLIGGGARLRNPRMIGAGANLMRGGMALAGAQSYGGTLEELRSSVEAGRLSESTARAAATGAALLEVALEKMLPGIEKRALTETAIEAGKQTAAEITRRGIAAGAARTIGGEILQETVEEAISEAYGVGLDLAFQEKKPTLLEAVRRIGNAAVIGGVSGGLMSAPVTVSEASAESARLGREQRDRQSEARVRQRADEMASALVERGIATPAEGGTERTNWMGGNVPSSWAETYQLDGRNQPNYYREYAESTSENTSTPLPPAGGSGSAAGIEPLFRGGEPVSLSPAGDGTPTLSPLPPSPARPLIGLMGARADEDRGYFDRLPEENDARRAEAERASWHSYSPGTVKGAALDEVESMRVALAEDEDRAAADLDARIDSGSLRQGVRLKDPLPIIVTSKIGQPPTTFDPLSERADPVGGIRYDPREQALIVYKHHGDYAYIRGVTREVLDEIVGPQTARVLTGELSRDDLVADIERDSSLESWDKYIARSRRLEHVEAAVNGLIEMRRLRLERLQRGERSRADDLWDVLSDGATERAWGRRYTERSELAIDRALKMGIYNTSQGRTSRNAWLSNLDDHGNHRRYVLPDGSATSLPVNADAMIDPSMTDVTVVAILDNGGGTGQLQLLRDPRVGVLRRRDMRGEVSLGSVPIEVLPDLIGPKMTERLLKQKPLTRDYGRFHNRRVLRGRDLLAEARQLRRQRLENGQRSPADDVWALISGNETEADWARRDALQLQVASGRPRADVVKQGVGEAPRYVEGSTAPALEPFPRLNQQAPPIFQGRTRGGAAVENTVPRQTVQVGPFEAPGQELGTYEQIPEGEGVWRDAAEFPEYPTAADPSVIMGGRENNPPEMMLKVANRGYTAGFIAAAKRLFGDGEQPGSSAMQVLQSVADRVLGGKQPVKADITLGEIIAGAQGQYGWSGHERNIAINPAEFFHYAVVNVAAEEKANGKPYTPEEQRQRIIRLMAEKQVEILLHEAAHYWGPDGGTAAESHGGDFEKLFKPIQTIVRSVINGTLTASQIARIEKLYGFETGQVRAIAAEITEMIQATVSTFSETFATVEGQADELSFLNQDAKEQRLLALPIEERQRGTTTERPTSDRDDLGPDDVDVGGGPPPAPVDGPGLVRGDGPGPGGDGLQRGEGDAPPGPEPAGADGVRPPESAPAEPELTDPRPLPEMVTVLQKLIERVVVNDGTRIRSEGGSRSRALQFRAQQIADRVRGHAPYATEIGRVDPRVLRWALGFRAVQLEDTLARAILQKLYGDGVDVSPNSLPVVGYFTEIMARGISMDPNPEQRWNAGEVQRTLGIRDPDVANDIIRSLIIRGVLDNNGKEVAAATLGEPEIEGGPALEQPSPGVRLTPPSAELSTPVTESVETATPPVQGQEPASRPSTPRPERATTPSSRPTPQTNARAERLDRFFANVDDDGWVLGLAAKGRKELHREGLRLANAVIVDGDKNQTATNRQAVIDAIEDRRFALHQESRRIEKIPSKERSEQDRARLAQIKEVRAALQALLSGFGHGADRIIESNVTERLPDRNGKVRDERIARFRVTRTGDTAAVVRGIGKMQVRQGVTEGTKAALDVLATNVARLDRTAFVDENDNLVGMTEWLSRGIEIFYGGRDVSARDFIADMTQVADAFLAQNPDIDATQPQMLGLLMQAFQLQVQDAFRLVEEARQADFAAGQAKEPVLDPITGVELGKGPRTVEALKALNDLMTMSTLLPSIKKIATTSGRNLRAMQMAEERGQAQSHLRVLHGLDKSVGGLVDLLKKVQDEIKAGRNADEILRDFRLLDGTSLSEQQIQQIRAGTPTGDLIRMYAQRDGSNWFKLFDDYAGVVESMADIRDRFISGDDRGSGLLTIPAMRKLQQKIEAERAHFEQTGERLYDDAEIKEMIEQVWEGMAKYRRRLNDRRVDPSDPKGRSFQTTAKESWRKDGDNWGLELLNARLDRLDDRARDALLQQIEAGLDAKDANMRAWWDQPARPGATYTREELKRHLIEKQVDLLRSKPRRSGATTQGQTKAQRIENHQYLLGDAYRREMMLDGEIEAVKAWLADARNGRAVEDPATVEALLAEVEAEREATLVEIEEISTDISIDTFQDLFDALDKRDRAQTEADAKLTDADFDSLVALHLGAAVQQKIDRAMLLEAMSNREIGKVEKEVRRLMKEHYHRTFDERVEVDYWVGFLEQVQREFGQSTDPDVQAKLAEIRDRAAMAVGNLALHPQYGEGLARNLNGRMIKAIHGDAGALVLGIRDALTSSNYLIDDERHPDFDDIQALLNKDLIADLAGTADAPGPLARVIADREDGQASVDLIKAMNAIEDGAPNGLGAAFKDAVYGAIDIHHKRAAILEMLPLVEANPTDSAVRYMVEMQLHDLKQHLANRETEAWFRRRFGGTEIALRRQYERAVEKGANRLEREAERAAEAYNTYEALVNAGVATQADWERAQDGTPPKKTATEIIIERLDRQKAEGLAKRIRVLATAYWSETDAAQRDRMEGTLDLLMEQLDDVGAHWNTETGEKQGIGTRMARQLAGQLQDREFKEQERQGIRQQGWDQRDEIKTLEREIRLVHRHLLASDPGSPEAASLQQELQDLMADLHAVGATEREDNLREMGKQSAERLQKDLDIKTVRFVEREADRRFRRVVVEEVRDLRQAAMAFVRDLARDPNDKVARDALYTVLDEMAQIGWTESRDVTITDRDPTNGGVIGTRTERQDVLIRYGHAQAQKIADMVDVRIGSSVSDLDAMTGTASTRDEETNIIHAVKERLSALATAGRESDDLGRIGEHIGGLIEVLEKLGERGRQAAETERERLRTTGFTRAMMRGDADSREQVTTFFQMLQPQPNPQTGRMEYNPRSVGRALKLVTAPNWADYYREYGVVAMLSSPTTWGPLGVNTIGQLLNVAIQPTRWVYKLAASKALGALGYERSVYGSEATAATRKLFSGKGSTEEDPSGFALWKRAGKSAWQIWWHGHSEEQMRRSGETGDLSGLRSEYMTDRTADSRVLAPLHLLARIGHMSSLRILKATDEFIGMLAYEAAYAGQLERMAQQTGKTQAEVEGDINLLSKVVEKTGKVRSGILFQDRDGFLRRINMLTHPTSSMKKTGAEGAAAQLLDIVAATYVPFTTVPYNAIKQSIELSGLGAVGYGVASAVAISRAGGGAAGARQRVAEERKKTSAEMDVIDPNNEMGKMRAVLESERVADYMSKAALGATVQFVAYLLASAGLITGDEPDDQDERLIDQEEKLPPRSIYIPRIADGWITRGGWYSYDSTPFAVPFAISANIANRWRKEWAGLATNGVDSPWLATGFAAAKGAQSAVFGNFFLENLVEAASQTLNIDKTTTAETRLYGLASPLVTRHIPALLAYYARQGDAFERDTRSDNGTGGRIWNLARSRVSDHLDPFNLGYSRSDLPVRVGLLGQPVENRQPFGAGLISYSRSEQAQFDQLFRVLEKYEIKRLSSPKTISEPGRKEAEFEITLDEQRAWQKTFGENLRKEVTTTYNNPNFKRIYNVAPGQSREDALENNQKQLLEKAVERARDTAARSVIQGLGATPRDRSAVMNERIRQYRKKITTTPDDVAS